MNQKNLVVAALIVAMAITRFEHFGSAISLPDASLAVFFLAGLGLASPWLFVLLVVQAGLIDYWSINQLNVSDYCMSPAYWFLLPTYAVMWLTGRYARRFIALNIAHSLKTFGLIVGAVTLAFAISNSSFYWFSGKFADMSWFDYLSKTGHYYWVYLSTSVIYSLTGLTFVKVWRLLHGIQSSKIELG